MKAIVCVLVALLACVAAYDVELLSEEQWDKLVERNRKCLWPQSRANKSVVTCPEQPPSPILRA